MRKLVDATRREAWRVYLALENCPIWICFADQGCRVGLKRGVEQILRMIASKGPPTAICRDQRRAYQAPRAIKRQRDFDTICLP